MQAFDLVPAGRQARLLIVDGTLGLGGHSEKLLRRYPGIRIVGLDWDVDALETSRQRLEVFGDRFEAVEASYAEIPSILSQRGRGTVDGLLLDLGLSSRQLLDSGPRDSASCGRGRLDMRMSRSLTRRPGIFSRIRAKRSSANFSGITAKSRRRERSRMR